MQLSPRVVCAIALLRRCTTTARTTPRVPTDRTMCPQSFELSKAPRPSLGRSQSTNSWPALWGTNRPVATRVFGGRPFPCDGHVSLGATGTHADYQAAVQMCSVNVTAHRRLAVQIGHVLRPDLRKDGSRGRALTSDLGPLRKGDRLDAITCTVSGQRIDSGAALGALPVYPVTLHFWRKCAQSFLNHRCRLFEDSRSVCDRPIWHQTHVLQRPIARCPRATRLF